MQFKMTARNTGRILAAASMALAAQSAWSSEAGTFSVGAGLNTTSGKYGSTSTTDITSMPLTAAYETGPWVMKLTVPYVRISGATDVVVGVGRTGNGNRGNGNGNGGGGTTTATTATTTQTASGLGDVVAAVTYNFYNNAAAQFGADLTGKVKFGTGDQAKGLGTGETDYALQLDVYKKLDAKWSMFGALGYAVLGSSPALPLDNVFNAGIGASYRISERNSAGLSYDYRQKTSDTGFAMSEVTAFVTHKFAGKWKAQGYVLKGFSDGSPDWGAGATVGYAF